MKMVENPWINQGSLEGIGDQPIWCHEAEDWLVHYQCLFHPIVPDGTFGALARGRCLGTEVLATCKMEPGITLHVFFFLVMC